MPWNDSVWLEVDKVFESIRRKEKYKLATNERRSFKEVVEDLPHPGTLVDSIDEELRMKLDKLNINGVGLESGGRDFSSNQFRGGQTQN